MNIPQDVLWSIAGFFGAMLVLWIKGVIENSKKRDEKETDTLKRAVEQLIKTVGELRYEVRMLNEKIALVPKLNDDVRKAFEQIKDIKRLQPVKGNS